MSYGIDSAAISVLVSWLRRHRRPRLAHSPDTSWQPLTYSKQYRLTLLSALLLTSAFLALAILTLPAGAPLAVGALASGALWAAILLAALDAFVFPVDISSVGLRRAVFSSNPAIVAWPELLSVNYHDLGGYFVFRSRHASIRVVAYADGLLTLAEYVKRYAPEAERERAWLIPQLSKSTEAA